MTPTRQGSIHLFRAAGINVYLHWSWFLVAAYEISTRRGEYGSLLWNVLEYVALFCLVLMHEFGHSLACRQVGGQADQIVLWPLGGVAYVQPPQRPGATLWSIAAGPLVNLVLVPVFWVLGLLLRTSGLYQTVPDARGLWHAVFVVNVTLLVFNLLPVYPLDGGQILRSLLWFVLGRARSLLVATVIGFLGVGALVLFALLVHSVWMLILCAFILLNCWGGLRHALALARVDRAPRRAGFACPSCGSAPHVGAFWFCGRCRTPFDTFASNAVCPRCGAVYAGTPCGECGTQHHIDQWRVPPPISPPAV